MAPENGGGSAAQHSGSMYSMLAHVPGLKCVVPSDAYTAKGLMTAAIRDDDPVMYFSHRRLLGASCDVPEEPYVIPIGQARTLHLVIVDEDTPRCSVASDIAAVVAEQAIDYLDGPVKAVTGAHAPVPYSGPLEAAFVPSPERVVAAVRAARDGAD